MVTLSYCAGAESRYLESQPISPPPLPPLPPLPGLRADLDFPNWEAQKPNTAPWFHKPRRNSYGVTAEPPLSIPTGFQPSPRILQRKLGGLPVRQPGEGGASPALCSLATAAGKDRQGREAPGNPDVTRHLACRRNLQGCCRLFTAAGGEGSVAPAAPPRPPELPTPSSGCAIRSSGESKGLDPSYRTPVGLSAPAGIGPVSA